MRNMAIVASGLIILTGCGGSENSSESSGASGAVPSHSAVEVASAPATEKTDIDCDKFKPQAAEKGQPADDIVGLRHGMTEEQVRGVLLCKNPNYAINASKNSASLPSGGQMSRVDLNADTGLDKVNVWLLGPQGGERVVHIDRTIEYAAGKELPIANIMQELSGKYGMFDDAGYGNQRSGWIVRSRGGERITASNTSYSECRNHSLRTDKVVPCLHAISYEFVPNPQNPALASRFNVGITSFAMTDQMVAAAKDHNAKAVEQAEENAQKEKLEL